MTEEERKAYKDSKSYFESVHQELLHDINVLKSYVYLIEEIISKCELTIKAANLSDRDDFCKKSFHKLRKDIKCD